MNERVQQSASHEEPLRVTEHDGLTLPEALCGRITNLTVRTPTGSTVCYRKNPLGPYLDSVRPSDFDTSHGRTNEEYVDEDEVYIEPHGEDGQTYAAAVEEVDDGE